MKTISFQVLILLAGTKIHLSQNLQKGKSHSRYYHALHETGSLCKANNVK